MKIYFIRHGHPDYTTDSLTAEGKLQAQACAERMKDRGITRIYSSSNGRAAETARYTGDLLGIDVQIEDFMREINWGPINGDPSNLFPPPGSGGMSPGQPWATTSYMAETEGINLLTYQEWRTHPYFQNNLVVPSVDKVMTNFAEFMKKNGYEKDNGRWRSVAPNSDTIAIFSHGGSGAAMLSELLGYPFPYICLTFDMNYTSITCFDLPVSDRPFVVPRIKKINDDQHVKTVEIVYGK